MGISEKIEDAKITADKTKISKFKQRSENSPKFARSNWTLRYKTVKTRKHYRKYLLLLNFGIWPHFTAILTTVSTVVYSRCRGTTWCHYKAENDKNSPLLFKWNIYQLWMTLNKPLNHFNPKNEDLPKNNEDLLKKSRRKRRPWVPIEGLKCDRWEQQTQA